jgi:hypothetical protein
MCIKACDGLDHTEKTTASVSWVILAAIFKSPTLALRGVLGSAWCALTWEAAEDFRGFKILNLLVPVWVPWVVVAAIRSSRYAPQNSISL